MFCGNEFSRSQENLGKPGCHVAFGFILSLKATLRENQAGAVSNAKSNHKYLKGGILKGALFASSPFPSFLNYSVETEI